MPIGRRCKPLGNIENPDRFSHVEHERFAAVAHGSGLDNELTRLNRCHEVASDLRVGNGDRTATGDLRAKRLEHRASRSQNIAESDAHPVTTTSIGVPRRQLFGETLRVAENAGWISGLVGRDVDKVVDTDGRCSAQNVVRPDHVGLPALRRIHLKQR